MPYEELTERAETAQNSILDLLHFAKTLISLALSTAL